MFSEEKLYTRNPVMEGFFEGVFETSDHVKIRYLHKGKGMPMIFLHGWGDDGDCWMLNAPEFARDHAVYCLDQRGNGASVAEHGARVCRLAADVHEFIEALGAEKVVLVGWSMGCSVIWSYIELFGESRIYKLVLDDEPPMLVANPRFTREEVLETGTNRMDFWYLVNACADHGWLSEEMGAAFAAGFHRGSFGLSDEEAAKVPGDYAEKMAQRPMWEDVPHQFIADLLKDHLLLDWRDLMPYIQSPVLYLTGDDSTATTPEVGEWMEKTIPHCTWVRFLKEEYGLHDLCQTAYIKFNRVVREFLEKE